MYMDAEINDRMTEPLIRIPIPISDKLNLDMGRGYIGFLNDHENGVYMIDLLELQMIGQTIYNNEDPWNGLTMEYTAKWPMNLLITSQFLEKYSNIFRYFFPLK